MHTILPGNEAVLAARAPERLARVARVSIPPSHAITATPGGDPLLAIDGVPLHHVSDPRADAARWARATVERLASAGATRVIVVGLGLGYHLEALAERFGGALTIVEPDAAVWRLALASRDLSAVLARADFADDPAGAAPHGEHALVLAHPPALLIAGGGYRAALERWQGSAAATGLRLKIMVVSPLYGGSLPIAGYAARALTRLGHEVQLVDMSGFHDTYRGLERFGARKAARAGLERGFCEVLGAGVVAAVEASEPDVVLAMAQAPLDAAALARIGAAGAIRALWFVEDFRLFTYWRDVAAHYDYVLTIQTDECHQALATVTDARLAYLPAGFDPEMHRPLALAADERAAYASDVAFVGAGYRNRRLAFRSFLDMDFRIWGSDWEGAGDLAKVIQRGGARIGTEETVRIFNAARVHLNLHSSTYHDGVDPRGDFVNPRTFELAGSGAFQITDARALLPPLFADDEIVTATSVAAMRELTRHYLAHDAEREAMAARARRRARAEHTYDRRMEALVATIVGREHERLHGRRRTVTVGDVAAAGDGPLERFLRDLDPATPFTVDAVVATIPEREGALSDPEALFLFLHQFDDLYLQEYRA